MIKKILTLITLAVIVAATGCATDNSQIKSEPAVKPAHRTVIKLKIKPFDVKVVAGKTVSFEVTGLDAEGQTIIIPADWKLSENSAGTLDSTRGNKIIFTAKKPGKTILEAEYSKLKDSVNIEVVVKIY